MSLPNTHGCVAGRNLNCWRNRVAVRLANGALKIATPEYRGFIKGSIRLGLTTAASETTTEVTP